VAQALRIAVPRVALMRSLQSSSEEGAAGDDGEEEVVLAALGEDAESREGDMDLS
jgi:hypothetical protein